MEIQILKIDYEKNIPPCFTEPALLSSEVFQGYDENQAFQGMGEVIYYFKGDICPTNGKISLTKPIIVLDGFDPGDTRSGAEIYGNYLKYGDNQFLGDDLRKTTTNGIGGVDGYDVVILNFPQYSRILGGGLTTGVFTCPYPADFCIANQYHPPIAFQAPNIRQEINGGADYMERNAMVLIELIRNTNATLKANGSNEKIIIVGPSMGGLISRYALAYMEKKLAENPNDATWKAKWEHNCRLWISFDSPHQGANIAIGAQYFLQYFATSLKSEGAKASLENKIRSNAAQQLLLQHELNTAQNYRNTFVSTINSLGFPNPTNDPNKLRKIAITNGSINSTKFSAIECEQVLTVRSNLAIRGGKTFILYTNQPVVDGQISFSGSYNKPCLVFNGSSIKSNLSLVYASSNNFSYDKSPGGYINTFRILSDEGSSNFTPGWGGSVNFGGDVHFNVKKDVHSFIPTKSSLAFKGTNTDLSEDLSGRSLVCTGETPFDSYYSPLTNESHVSLTQKSVDYVLSEIRGIPQKPRINLSVTKSVNGSSCSNTSYTFSVPNLGAGITYNWQVPSGATITSGAGTNQITLTATNTGEVTVNITGNCGEFVVLPSYIDHVGQLYYPNDFTVTGPSSSSLCPNSSYSFGATANVNKGTPLTYTWLVQNATIVSGQGTSQIQIQTGSSSSSSVAVLLLSISNSCGTGSSSPVVNSYNTRCGSFAMKAYPNPADQQMTITAVSNPQTASKSTASTDAVQIEDSEMLSENDIIVHINDNVKIYDSNNKPVWSGKFENGKVNIPVNKMQNGFYYVKIEGENSVTKRIFIQH